MAAYRLAVAVTDPLARFWVHEVLVERWAGQRAAGGGDRYDTADPIKGWVSDGSRLVAGPDGNQIASSAQVAFPPGTPYIPLRSRITLPPKFATAGTARTLTVVAAAVADGAGLPTPDHLSIALM